MANYVINKIFMEGDESRIEALMESVKVDPADDIEEEQSGFGTIDFEKVLPTPKELLEIDPDDKEARIALSAYIYAADPKTSGDYVVEKLGEDEIYEIEDIFETLCFDPERLNDYKKQIAEQLKELEKEGRSADILKRGKELYGFVKRYGAWNWYDWRYENWGTKWNAYDQFREMDGFIFNTAWAHANGLIQALSKQWPDIRFTHSWADENLGHNCGTCVFKAGKIVEERIPEAGREAVKFSLDMWDEEPEDAGLFLNADESDYIYGGFYSFPVIRVNGAEVLFSPDMWVVQSSTDIPKGFPPFMCGRLTLEDIPKGLRLYHLFRDELHGCLILTKAYKKTEGMLFMGSVVSKTELAEGPVKVEPEEIFSKGMCVLETFMLFASYMKS